MEPTTEQRADEGFGRCEVDGAKLLADLVHSFMGAGYTYEKVEYDVLLTKWLIKNVPADLQEMADLLQNILTTDGGQWSS